MYISHNYTMQLNLLIDFLAMPGYAILSIVLSSVVVILAVASALIYR